MRLTTTDVFLLGILETKVYIIKLMHEPLLVISECNEQDIDSKD